ncbi:MAG TPA: hypothetical protein VGO26_06990 [Amnibacterium sp.]|jgi:hypothetical protein|nr:hypothetical protein [Amnibacterium sp.]
MAPTTCANGAADLGRTTTSIVLITLATRSAVAGRCPTLRCATPILDE